tara:strand:- start:1372 stop:1545 length:174 start_codon:yes stop_codon:yes gene_type:complete
MEAPKVIITKQTSIPRKHSLEYEIGLSTFDLALISINKITNNRKSNIKEQRKNTYLI